MGQDADTGRQGRDYGYRTADAVAAKLGARRCSATSNEFIYRRRLVAIKTAGPSNNQFGFAGELLARVQEVIFCKEEPKKTFTAYFVPASVLPAADAVRQDKMMHVTLATVRTKHTQFKRLRLD
jgi:hypothetical protein